MYATPEQFVRIPGGNERRSRPRHAPKSIAYVKVGETNGGVIIDLSESGMSIASVEPLQENSNPLLRFELPRIDRTFEVSAELVWEADSKTKAGLRFVSLSVDERVHIRNWIKDELFAEAFPSQVANTAAKKRLPFSQETLIASESVTGANQMPREAKPRVPAKILPDILAPAPITLPQEFERLFPSERKGGVQPVQPVGKLETAPAEAKIETTAYWLNFPSEADVPPRKAEASESAAIAEAPKPNSEIEAGVNVQEQHENWTIAPAAEPVEEARAVETEVVAPEAAVASPEHFEEPAFVRIRETPSPISAAGAPRATSEEKPTANAVNAMIFLDTPCVGISAAEDFADVPPTLPDAESTPFLVNGPATQQIEVSPTSSFAQADEPGELPFHELNPAPEGPAFVAANLDLIDIAHAVREPGKFSGGAVSDASIESLLAIAEAEESSVQSRSNTSVVPAKKPMIVRPPLLAPRTRPAADSAAALPHVALRSPSQQVVPRQELADGDKRYRGLVVAACFIFLALCFAVGYSRHVQLPWTSAGPQADSSAVSAAPLAKAYPVSSSATAATAPSSTAAASSPVSADSKFTAPPLPSTPTTPPPSFFPVTAPAEGNGPRMIELPEVVVFDSPKVLIRLHQFFFIQPQPGPEWSHSLDRIQIGEPTVKMPPQPATDADWSVVHIRATVGKDGVVQSARPISGPVNLIPRSVEAIQKWRYQPSILDGQPIAWQGDFAIEFRPAS